MENAATREKVFAYAKKRRGTEPEYLWRDSPESAVLRRADSKKWYGIVMRVPRERLHISGEGSADVLNVKCPPELIGSLLKNEGYFPAYHMNKESWVSVLLDSAVLMGDVEALLDISFGLVGKQLKEKVKNDCQS